MLRRSLLLSLFVAVSLLAQEAKPDRLQILVQVLGAMDTPEKQNNILKGMLASLQGQRGIPEPKGWAAMYAKLKDSPNEEVRASAQALSVIFGSGAAMDEMRARLLDAAAPIEQRRKALDSLVAQKDTGALDALLKLAVEPSPLREPALRGLAGFDDPRLAPAITGAYAKLDSTERRAAVQTLLARASGAKAFIAAIDSGAIPKAELIAPIARQIQGLKDPALDAWLTKNWAAVNPTSADKQALIAKFKEFLHPDLIQRADASHGRALFTQTCYICHTMWGVGGRIGPELTGGYEDIDYLLNNILDPNAIIGKDYQQTFVKTKDNQVVSGIVTQDTDTSISLKNLSGEIITLQRSDVASTEVSPLSMMPEGLIASMPEEDVRDLFFYLRKKQQVPMLLTVVNANDFFNGTDLRFWHASEENAWRVEKGELAGKGGTVPVSLTSEIAAGDYRLTAQVKTTGPAPAAELVLSGENDAEHFHGTTLSFGGPSRANVWEYLAAAAPKATPAKAALGDGQWHTVEVVRKGESLRVSIDGQLQYEAADARHRRRVQPAFWVKDGELRVKGLKIELPQ
jgi:putative heme-binding domain-containing protein